MEEEIKNVETAESEAVSEQKTKGLSEKTKAELWQGLKFLLFSISAGVIISSSPC